MSQDNGSRRLRIAAALGLFLGVACQRTTDGGGAPQPDPSYIWTGLLLDSATGDSVSGLTVAVREWPEHAAQGWAPHLDTSLLPRFAIHYSLRGIPLCNAFPETTLTVHLEFADPLGRYEPKVHRSDSFVVCPRVLPPVEQLPLNWEDSLRLQFVRRP